MSNKAVRELPENYVLRQTLDLNKNVKLAIGLNLASLVLFVLFGVLFFGLLSLARPGLMFEEDFVTSGLFASESIFTRFLFFALLYLGMIVLHEVVHGLFFWLFTKDRPKFGFRGLYAYAGAPDWYLAKWPYLIVGLAPLVLISVVGFIAMLFVPIQWVFPILFFITLNASGAVGDIYAFFWILPMPNGILVQDIGDRMEVFGPNELMSETVENSAAE
ncbi:MAG: DUF3267 domain-containing protein [Brevefilum sp.]